MNFFQQSKQMFFFSLPVIAAYLGQLSMQLVDVMVVGRLNDAVAIGAQGYSHALFAVPMVTGFGLISCLDYFIGHAFGAKNYEDCRKYLIHALVVTLILSIAASFLCYIFSFYLDIFGTTPEIAKAAKNYLQIISFSMPSLLIFMAVRSYLQATNQNWAPMVILIFGNIFNLFINIALVHGKWGFPAMELEGSALATFLARNLMTAFVLIYAFSKEDALRHSFKKYIFNLDFEYIKNIFRLGFPSSVQMFFEVGAFSVASILASRLGAIPLAAHQLVLQIASFTFMMPLGVSSATAVLVSQNLGAKNLPQVKYSGWLGFAYAVLIMSVNSFLLYYFANPILMTFTQELDVIAASKQILIIVAFFQIFDGLQVVGAGAMRGTSNTKIALVANLAGHWVISIPLGIFLCFSIGWQLPGLWTGLATGLFTVSAILLTMWVRWCRKNQLVLS